MQLVFSWALKLAKSVRGNIGFPVVRTDGGRSVGVWVDLLSNGAPPTRAKRARGAPLKTHVVGSCWAKFETVKLLSQQLPTFFSEASYVGSVSTTLQILLGPLTRITHVYKVLRVVSFPPCTEGPNIVWSCCIRFLTTANTDATTLNIVGPTMLGVVGSFCT